MLKIGTLFIFAKILIEQFTFFINDVAMLRLVVGNTKFLVIHSHRYSYALLK